MPLSINVWYCNGLLNYGCHLLITTRSGCGRRGFQFVDYAISHYSSLSPKLISMAPWYSSLFPKPLAAALVLVFSLQASHAVPLSPTEKAAVLAEIEAMVRTNQRYVDAFVMTEGTPDLVRRLYESPDLATLSKSIRVNGMPLAGRGSGLLTFEKPSDVVQKMTTWFPEEMAAVRANNEERLWTGTLRLWGPFENWDQESIAFASLWQCMPQSAWVRPAENPFRRRPKVELPMLPTAAHQSTTNEFDFKFCVQSRAAYIPGWTREESQAYEERAARIGTLAMPVLRDKFSMHLKKNQCRGTGPDDCVLVLWLWASLQSEDPELAATIQELEPLIGPDTSLPDLSLPFDRNSSRVSDGEARFDEALRRAAYLRAKLLSIQSVPEMWPTDAFATTLKQLSALQRAYNDPFPHRWSYYKIDRNNEHLSPWQVLPKDESMDASWRSALLGEMEGLENRGECDIFNQWSTHTDKTLQPELVLQRLRARQPLKCGSIDFALLRMPGWKEELYAYLALIGHLSGHEQDALMTGLTDAGESCFGKQKGQPDWLRQLCRTWISEPQNVRIFLKHTRVSLAKRYRFSPRALPDPRDDSPAAMSDWISHLVPGRENELRSIAATLEHAGARAYSATEWRHPKSDRILVELTLSQEKETTWPFLGGRVLLLVAPEQVKIVGIPRRFSYQYDDGSITAVSDLDRDGKPEVWFGGSFGECDGEGLRPGIDCAIEAMHLGEIFDDSVSYFSYEPPKKK